MLDEALAELYDVETKRLNEQIKRNIARFPEDFMFQLSQKEFDNLKSQIATSSWGGRRKLPYAFPKLCKASYNLEKKNYLFAGSHAGAQSAAMFYSFLATCKHNNVNPYTWLKKVLEIIPDYPANKLSDLLPQNLDLS